MLIVRATRTALAATTIVLATWLGAPPAVAAFTSPFVPKCSGASVTGSGAPTGLNVAWAAAYGDPVTAPPAGDPAIYCDGTIYTNSNPNSRGTFDGDLASPAFPLKRVTFEPAGGPPGALATMGVGGVQRGLAPAFERRFAETPQAPDTEQIADANDGDPANPNDDAQLRTIPVASRALVFLVNYPDHCTIPKASAFKPADGSYKYPAGSERIKLTRSRLEYIFQGNANSDTWGEVVPGIDEVNDTDSRQPDFRPDGACAAQAVKRVVRRDAASATTTVKRWFDLQRPTIGWDENEEGGLANQAWPNDSGSTAVLRSASDGDGNLAILVSQQDGSFGYSALSTARTRGFEKQNTAADTTWWQPVQDQVNSYKEPTYSPESYKAARAAGAIDAYDPGFTPKKGANCRTTLYADVPDNPPGGPGPEDTLGPSPDREAWDRSSGADQTGGYPLCALTYMLAWDDAFDAFGAGVDRIEEARQKTVKDFLFLVLSNTGQNLTSGYDAAPVPTSILLGVSRPAQLALTYNAP
jgi:hypothetical protein